MITGKFVGDRTFEIQMSYQNDNYLDLDQSTDGFKINSCTFSSSEHQYRDGS